MFQFPRVIKIVRVCRPQWRVTTDCIFFAIASSEEIYGRLPFFSKLFQTLWKFPNQRVWKSLKKLEKSFEKLFQNFAARNYSFNAIINSIIFPARVEIHKTRFVAGTFTQPSERPFISQKLLVIFTFSNFFSKVEIA